MEDSHIIIMERLGELKQVGEGTNRRLDTLNGSVAKHENRLNGQDVLNAQMTLTQQQIVEKLNSMDQDKKSNKTFWRGLLVPLAVSATTFIFVLVLTKLGILDLSNKQSTEELEQAFRNVLEAKYSKVEVLE